MPTYAILTRLSPAETWVVTPWDRFAGLAKGLKG